MPDQSITAQADALVGVGRARDGYELLAKQAAAGNPEANFALGFWRLSGRVVNRDLAAARALFEAAAKDGYDDATQIHVSFLANGTGGPADWPKATKLLAALSTDSEWAAAQLRLIEAMAIDATGNPTSMPPPSTLSERPSVRCFRGLFSVAECDLLVCLSEPYFTPSVVIDPRTGNPMHDPIRTSEGTFFPFVREAPAIHALNRRLAAATGSEVRQGEPLQVLRYRPGQEYKPHIDALDGQPNQRVMTALIYLNEDYTGGETVFNRIDLQFRGSRGDALVFQNSTATGDADPMTQHAGLPVLSGSKLLASRWIRARPFSVDPPVPILPL